MLKIRSGKSMNIFVDTSAFLAVLDGSDKKHTVARLYWEKIIRSGDVLLCHNYILVETSALILRRLGMEAVHVFEQDIKGNSFGCGQRSINGKSAHSESSRLRQLRSHAPIRSSKSFRF
jgi:hypothetical protein